MFIWATIICPKSKNEIVIQIFFDNDETVTQSHYDTSFSESDLIGLGKSVGVVVSFSFQVTLAQ